MWKKNAAPEEKNVPDYAPYSEMIDMQKIAGTQSEESMTEDADAKLL